MVVDFCIGDFDAVFLKLLGNQPSFDERIQDFLSQMFPGRIPGRLIVNQAVCLVAYFTGTNAIVSFVDDLLLRDGIAIHRYSHDVLIRASQRRSSTRYQR
jgi:hypothetical protein